MVIGEIPTASPTHFLLLNKFPIIAEHFMLVTKANKLQTAKLEPDDLAATFACLEAWTGQTQDGRQRRLFAFFNSGEHSGASQAHRHVQFLPVESMAEGLDGQSWELLMDRLTESPAAASRQSVPFTYFWSPLPPSPTPNQLLEIYNRLYDASFAAVQKYQREHPDALELHDTADGSSPFSYNLGMTTSAMVMCPRRREATALEFIDNVTLAIVALNGTLLGGSMLVKTQGEYDFLRKTPELVDEVLEGIGIPKDTSIESKI